ncbi:hypothetical protein [Diaphorobacter caeni]|uniref:hypothetical protein n=1 Tax=Diaphorobacter caeni TaxID=2784387 RepID=UPI00188F4D3F|nr:hypothetical protein [Diaphorobacter caeni]MBF5006011.1 hypothetical protein [Diaphorobacter caeni]
MRIAVGILATVILLGGCAKRVKVVDPNFVPHEFKSSASSLLPLSVAAGICAKEFPGASNPQDDGDNNFTVQNTVNVRMEAPTQSVICSINETTRELERVHDGRHVLTPAELARQRAAMREGQAQTERIAKGDYADFLKTAKRVITDKFKDPESTRFRDLYFSNAGGMPTLCGQLNSKNSYGAYVGYRGFYYNSGSAAVETEDGRGTGLAYSNMSKEFCSSKFRDLDQ